MKYYISQPMKDCSEQKILEIRETVISKIKNMDNNAEIIDSYLSDYKPCDGNVALKFLSRALEKLADADVAVFVNDWNTARGCSIEHTCALKYGIRPMYVMTK